jgi:tRNA pseudouridine synthase 10
MAEGRQAAGKHAGDVLGMEMLDKAQRMLENHPLCNHCLGRQFAFLGYGIDNQERGRTLKTLLTMKGHGLTLSNKKEGVQLLNVLAENGAFPMAAEILRKLRRRPKKPRTCFLCEGCFSSLPSFVENVAERLQGYDYDSFLVGIKLPTEAEEKGDEFKAQFEVQHSESIRNELSREIGKILSDRTGKTVDFMKPQIVVLADPFTGKVWLQVNPLFIMGRYRKLIRGIPQSKWFCPKCRGKGCPQCNGTGKLYPESVEELVAEPSIEVTQGNDASFHGAGREDIDARMLGRGRPFIIQIKRPRKRAVDLSELERVVNERAKGKIAVRNLRFADRHMIRKLKHLEASRKTYRLTVMFDRNVADEELRKLEHSLTGAKVLQQTPMRVLHRRADRTREKHIYEARVKRISPNSILFKIKCQGGLYVKELVTGDDGRTEPSITEIVGSKAEPLDLDVLNISSKAVDRK